MQPGDLVDGLLGDNVLDVKRAKPEPFVSGPLRLLMAFQGAEDLLTDDYNVLSEVADEQVGLEPIIDGASRSNPVKARPACGPVAADAILNGSRAPCSARLPRA